MFSAEFPWTWPLFPSPSHSRAHYFVRDVRVRCWSGREIFRRLVYSFHCLCQLCKTSREIKDKGRQKKKRKIEYIEKFICERDSEKKRERKRKRKDITAQTARHHDAATGADWTVIAFWVRLIDMGTGRWAEGRAATSALKPCLRLRELGMRERWLTDCTVNQVESKATPPAFFLIAIE